MMSNTGPNYILICIAKPNFILNDDDFELIFRKLQLQSVEEIYRKCETVRIFRCISSIPIKEKELARRTRIVSASLNNLEINAMEESRFLYPKKLVIFDLDSTLIMQETIDLVAELSPNRCKINEISQLARAGEINFKDAIVKRVQLLEGIRIDDLESLFPFLTLAKDTKETIEQIQQAGIKIALVSGSFAIFAEYVAKQLGIDLVFANNVIFISN